MEFNGNTRHLDLVANVRFILALSCKRGAKRKVGGEMASVETLTSVDIQPKVLGVPGPVALDFYQESCPPCHVLEPRLEKVAERYKDRLPIYQVDVDRDMPVAERFGVMSLPTVLILRDGREVERLDGLIREKDLEAAFDRTLGG
jgi:thioredoxin 1